jgi:polar amino acid transport system substrate-binding protein
VAARSRSLIALLVVVGVALVLFPLLTAPPPVPPSQFFPYHELRVGIDPGNPPFAVATDNDLFGLDIDISRELGRRLDVPVRFVYLGFDGLYDSLKTDQADAVIAGVSADLSRLRDVHYSQPYFNAGLVLVSGGNYTHMEDLQGKRLAYEFGSEAEVEARRWLRRIQPFELRPYELTQYALDAVLDGDADAALVDAVSAHLYRREYADWAAAVSVVTDNWYAVATQSRRPEISVALSDALQAMIDDGTLDAIIERWL